jgi:hypothetical protein
MAVYRPEEKQGNREEGPGMGLSGSTRGPTAGPSLALAAEAPGLELRFDERVGLALGGLLPAMLPAVL